MSVFDCCDCGADTHAVGEDYMVVDEVWQQAGGVYGMLCIGCLEKRLGHQLTLKDFRWAPINVDAMLFGSSRLQDRLGTKSLLSNLRYGRHVRQLTIMDDCRLMVEKTRRGGDPAGG
jgi:hypothetical protein